MLETIVLDNTERLLAASGARSELSNITNLVSAQSQMTCYARDSKAAFPYSALANAANYTGGAHVHWLSAASNVLLVAEQTGSFNVIAINLTTGAMTQDSTARQFRDIHEDASGVIWANAVDAANYGLWKRTGAGAWTKLLADTGVGYLRRFTDNTIYYVSTGGNWYTLAAGAATVSSNPLGYAWHSNARGHGIESNDNCVMSVSYPTGLGRLTPAATYFGSESNIPRFWPISACGQSGGTLVPPIGTLNWEFLAEATQANIANASTELNTVTPVYRIIRLDSTYALLVVELAVYATATSRLPNIGARKIVLTLLNKTTGVNKYLGSIYLTASSTISVSATAAAVIVGAVVGATLTNGVLDLWIAQGTYTTNVGTDVYGLFKKSLTLNLDF